MVTSKHNPILHILCGRLASGKTALAEQLAEDAGAVLFSEDLWLSKLFPGEIVNFSDYLSRSARFRAAIEPYVRTLLDRGISVVFDFAGNGPKERAWARSLCDTQQASVVLHYIMASDELCKSHLRLRNDQRPEGSQVTTEAEFDAITKYFSPPDSTEGFEIKEYDAESLRSL